ncbi:hypothetical protein D3C76_1576610 [compost metagenome]
MLRRVVKIEGYDLITNTMLYSSENIDISNGIYIVFEVKGIVKFRFTKIEGPDVVISGIFYD